MTKTLLARSLTALLLTLASMQANAAFDLMGPVQRVRIDSSGTLWFVMETTAAGTYFQKGWFDFHLYMPRDHPEYPYYYGMLVSVVGKGKSVYVDNISVFNGSTPCDITKTGYGLVLVN